MKDALSKIYFDDLPVRLLGDESRPPLDRIVRAGGKSPTRVDVLVLSSPKDDRGHLLNPSEIIDRTVEPAKPIYLRSVPKKVQTPAPTANSAAVIAQLGSDPAERRAGRDERKRKGEEAQAVAEGEAQERQEEDREQEGVIQDDQEDMEQAQEDEEMKA